MVDWDPKAVRKTLGLSTGGFEGTKRPKGLIHTTEGFTLASALAAYRNGGYAPHVTIGPHPDGGERVQRWQHYPFSSRATTLADASGGVRTNRLWVYQVEVVGTCDDAWKTRYDGRYARWHVDNWPAWYREAVAELMADWEDWFGIPRRSTVTWRSYPGSYGTGASQRLSGSEFTSYTGWLGHQHAPENTHGDPGDLDISDLFARMGDGPTVEEPVALTDADVRRILNYKGIPNINEPGGDQVNMGTLAGHLSNMEGTQDEDHRTLNRVEAMLSTLQRTVTAQSAAIELLAKTLAEHAAEDLDPDAFLLRVNETVRTAMASVVDVQVTVQDSTGEGVTE